MRHSLIDLRALPIGRQFLLVQGWDGSFPDAFVVVSHAAFRWWMPGRVITQPSLAGGFDVRA
jgi:hypothetical protein